jgi:hypothetical protein
MYFFQAMRAALGSRWRKFSVPHFKEAPKQKSKQVVKYQKCL